MHMKDPGTGTPYIDHKKAKYLKGRDLSPPQDQSSAQSIYANHNRNFRSVNMDGN